MGLFDFFKRKKQEKETEQIIFEDLESWILDKKSESKKKEQEFIASIDLRISQLVKELEQQVTILENIDLNNKKVEERIKFIVKENLNQYMYYLNKLIIDLKEFNKDSDIIKKLDTLFSDFEKRSIMNFQKATFIIGDELGKVREYLIKFSRDLKNILEENKDIIENIEAISFIDMKIKEILNIKNIKQETNLNIENNNKEIKKLEDHIKTIDMKIKQIENSRDYLEEEKKKSEIKKKIQELEKSVKELKEMVDFKSLSNIFHSIEKKMDIIKEFKENFKDSLQKDDGRNLISLFEGDKDLEKIQDKINKINKIKQEIRDITKIDLNKNLKEEKQRIQRMIQELESEIQKEKKRNDGIDGKKEAIKSLIKKELIKINVEMK